MKAIGKILTALGLVFISNLSFAQDAKEQKKEEPMKIVPVEKSEMKPSRKKSTAEMRSTKKISTVGTPKRSAVKLEKE